MGSEFPEDDVEVRWLSGEVSHVTSGVTTGEMSRLLAQSRGVPVWAKVHLLAGTTELGVSEIVGKQSHPLTALTVFGPMALTGAGDAALHLWSLETRECLGTLSGHSGAVTSVNVSFPKFRALSASRDCTLRYWDLAQMSCLGVLKVASPVAASAADFGRGSAVSCCQDRLVQLWDLDACACIGLLRGHFAEVRALVMEGCYVLSGSADRTARIWRLPSDSPAVAEVSGTPECCGVLAGHTAGVRALAANFTRSMAVSGADDCVLRVWDLSTQTCTAVLEGHGRPICCIAIDFERSLLWSAAGQGNLRVWDLEQQRCRATLVGHEGRVAVAIDLERGLVVTGGEDGDVKVWSSESLECIGSKAAAHRGPVLAVAV